MNIKMLTKNFGGLLNQNSPTILTGVAVAGLLATTIFAVKATPKALRMIEDEDSSRWAALRGSEDTAPPLDTKEIIQLVWKCYLPAVAMGAVTVACIVGSNSISSKRNAALVSVYSMSERALKEYQNKVVETVGENKAKKVKDAINKDKMDANPISKNTVVPISKGETRCYDVLSGRYFKSDINTIERVLNKLSRDGLSDMYIPLNEVYAELAADGLGTCSLGENIGWHVDDGSIEADFSSHLDDQGNPCLVLDYVVQPRYNVGHY